MTEQEAIEILEQDTKTLSEAINESNLERVKNVLSGRVEANNVAIKALEKQIPKKVAKVKIPNTSFCKASTRYKCPSCRVTLCSDWNFCFECGQKLDWSEEE